MTVGRYFLAVDLRPEVRHGLAAFLAEELGGRRLPGRAADPRSWHITLRYLGPSTGERLERFLHHLEVALEEAPFRLGFGGLGAFGRPRRASVLWLDVGEGRASLERLAAVAEEAAQAAGFTPEDRPFRPHLTLSRIRPPLDVSELVAQVGRFPLTQEVGEVVLFESVPGAAGPRYVEVARVPLPGA